MWRAMSAIIGGGITGAAIAHELTLAGCAVVVLDRRDIGTGSTSGSTSLLQYEIDVSLTDSSPAWANSAPCAHTGVRGDHRANRRVGPGHAVGLRISRA
jgi:choline dehydrogenase-like flavoprotein